MTEARTRIPLALALGLALLLGACQKQAEEGPAERAGKALDETMQDAGEKIEQMGKDIQKKVDEERQEDQEHKL